MNELERLDELRKSAEAYRECWLEQRLAVTKKLYQMLDLLNLGPAKLLPLKEKETVSIDNYRCFGQDVKWHVSKEIYFENQDPESKVGYDSHSSFSLYITPEHVTINHGSSGEWGLEDKGQWSRLILMKGIFEHEKDIIETLDHMIDMSVKEKFDKACAEINQINNDILEAKREREFNEIKKKLRPGKYLVRRGRHYIWDNEQNGHYEYYYHTPIKIEKITEVSIFAHECDNKGIEYTWIGRRLKIEDILHQLKYNELFVIDNMDEKPNPLRAEER